MRKQVKEDEKSCERKKKSFAPFLVTHKSLELRIPRLQQTPHPYITHFSLQQKIPPNEMKTTLIPPPSPQSTPLLFLTPTINSNGFLRNPSLVSSLFCNGTNSNRWKTVLTINASSISATFLPTQLLGP